MDLSDIHLSEILGDKKSKTIEGIEALTPGIITRVDGKSEFYVSEMEDSIFITPYKAFSTKEREVGINLPEGAFLIDRGNGFAHLEWNGFMYIFYHVSDFESDNQ